MARSNIEVIQAAFDAYLRGDLDAMFAETTPDLVTVRAAPQPDAGIYHGREGFMQALAEWGEGFSELEMIPRDLREGAPGMVVGRVHQRAVGAASGVPTSGDFWFVYELREGRIARVEFHNREELALAAAGITPGCG